MDASASLAPRSGSSARRGEPFEMPSRRPQAAKLASVLQAASGRRTSAALRCSGQTRVDARTRASGQGSTVPAGRAATTRRRRHRRLAGPQVPKHREKASGGVNIVPSPRTCLLANTREIRVKSSARDAKTDARRRTESSEPQALRLQRIFPPAAAREVAHPTAVKPCAKPELPCY